MKEATAAMLKLPSLEAGETRELRRRAVGICSLSHSGPSGELRVSARRSCHGASDNYSSKTSVEEVVIATLTVVKISGTIERHR